MDPDGGNEFGVVLKKFSPFQESEHRRDYDSEDEPNQGIYHHGAQGLVKHGQVPGDPVKNLG